MKKQILLEITTSPTDSCMVCTDEEADCTYLGCKDGNFIVHYFNVN